jgi:cytochrome c-type biogenesis protein CcmH/NrfG
MKEKDYIEDIILKNIEELNDNEPMEGHFARFEAKLNAQNKKTRRITFSVVWKVAAVVVFVLLAGNQAFMYLSPNHQGIFSAANKTQQVTLASISNEYQEVEFYYTSSINSGLDQWNKLNDAGLISEDEQLMMNEELAEFETLYKNLQEDLQSNPNDDRVINAMLEYYQAKLSVINIIVDKLEEVKQRNEIEYESL